MKRYNLKHKALWFPLTLTLSAGVILVGCQNTTDAIVETLPHVSITDEDRRADAREVEAARAAKEEEDYIREARRNQRRAFAAYRRQEANGLGGGSSGGGGDGGGGH